jgi:hypothetical protein
METLLLSDAIDAFLVCVAHRVAPVEPLDPISSSPLQARAPWSDSIE